jgi:NhaA family Na+:H+ antiporter
MAGPADAPTELVEYGDYECPHCRAAHFGLKRIRERWGERLKYAFRHLPNKKLHPHAELAAEAAEAAAAQGKFWEMHEALMTTGDALERATLIRLAGQLDLDVERFVADVDGRRFAQRVSEDLASAVASGAEGTPAFYVNGRRYDGAWDEQALGEAIDPSLAFRVRRLSQDFAGLPASGGTILLISTVVALVWANSPWMHAYDALWERTFALQFAAAKLELPLREWINQGLMALFFFVVGLEVKRELTVGSLASFRRAALPIAAAVGGMAVPAAIYAFANFGTPEIRGWGVPMSTDTAFALGLLALLGRHVPFALRVFVAALAIADDVGAILVIAVFYADNIDSAALATAIAILAIGLAMNRVRVYRPLPYALLGVCLWLAVLYSGIHATIAGVLLAIVIPMRAPPATAGLLNQSIAAFRNLEAPLPGREHDEGLYEAGVRSLETVVERLLSPAQRLERDLQPWSAYFVLPLLALANAGIPLTAGANALFGPVSLGITLGLVIGKPVGIALASAAVVRADWADLPAGVTWRQVAGAGCLCGIGFTMSIFIAYAAFDDSQTLTVAKLSTMLASVAAASLGWTFLRGRVVNRVADSQTPLDVSVDQGIRP